MILHKILEFFLRFFFLPISGTKIFDSEKIPREGGCILYSNHLSLWDPFMMHYACLPRFPRVMAKAELFKIPVIRGAIRSLKAFPVDRGTGDTSAIRAACDVLKEGHVLGIFPEGTRSKTGELGEMKQGTAMIAARAEVPMVPMYILNRYKWFGKTRIVVGDPFTIADIMTEKGLSRKEALRASTEFMCEKLMELKEIAEKL